MAQISLPIPNTAVSPSGALLAPNQGAENEEKLTLEEVDQVSVAGQNPFGTYIRLNEIKKYYEKMEKNYSFVFWLCLMSFLVYAYWMIVECTALWGGSIHGMPYGEALKKVSSSGKWAQVPIQFGLFAVLVGWFFKVVNLWSKFKQCSIEYKFTQEKYLPMGMTPGYNRRLMALFYWRINLYWLGVTLVGLGLISLAYGNACWGISKLVGIGIGNGNGKWYEFSFSSLEYHGYMACIGSFVAAAGILMILISNPILRLKINKVLWMFGMNEYVLSTEVKERIFRANKRDKMFCCVVLCIVGLVFYIIFKRLITTVFGKSLRLLRR